ncbi:helix-turn-helix transcriptional regulator [Paenibacillus sp. IB182496]|uniref:Helix-turn-helix transcriptional regulator n=1 Tax=Paenibacillus sabuli TaxID=2772509 RepID=A0A927BW07_9BACL|nr:AraC family transcriptional regulator [Paenibacillus sabuli]MBD2847357.1 helix-turn-helix transcriptional regulator [Paenibacillus sabuli]
MLDQFRPNQYRTLGPLFEADFPSQAAHLFAVGRARTSSPSYGWDGRTHADRGHWVLQYTLSGAGYFTADGRTRAVGEGAAFLAQIPGDFRYGLPPSSDHWEFVYILLRGELVGEAWQGAIDRLGPVPQLHRDSALVRLVLHIHALAAARQIVDSYQSASLAFQVVMELHRAARSSQAREIEAPAAVRQAMRHMREHYAGLQGLDELAAATGLSKYHFARLFRHSVGMTPLAYLTRVRMEEAAALLRHTREPVQTIAERVGYANGNYFGRLFRGATGVTPAQFRRDADALPARRFPVP